MKTIFLILLVLFVGCKSDKQRSNDQIKNEVWETVKSHNLAWSKLEDISKLETYIDANVISVSPPFKTPLYGKKAYLDGYQNWFDHASVDFFNEINPQIQLYLNGTMAIVIFEIEMSFVYDDVKTEDWKGRDIMTLTYENGRWLLVSDVFVQYSKE